MVLKKITPVQQMLFDSLKEHLKTESKTYEELKELCSLSSFDGSFNALLNKNYIVRDKSKNTNSFLINKNL